MTSSIAWFITPHGFGHATRTVAVMSALRARMPDTTFDVFSTVPHWLFENLDPIRFHNIECDVGLSQKSALEVDFEDTLKRLKNAPLFNPLMLDVLKSEIRKHECRLVYCDIAPLGIAAARAAGLPSVLVENFTWDWIYQGYLDQESRLKPYIRRFAAVYDQVDHHIQMKPPGVPLETARQVGLVMRPNRGERREIRDALNLEPATRMVLITMGGLAQNLAFMQGLAQHPDLKFFIPGAGQEADAVPENVTLVPHDDHLYHPDLVLAADAVVGKLGYSTMAEVAAAGTPFGFIERYAFRESPVLAEFVQKHLPHEPIAEAEFHNGEWLAQLPDLLAQSHRPQTDINGAEEIAEFLTELV